MMTVLIAGLALVGSLGALNLVLMLGVIKRLREHTELLSANGAGALPGLSVGAEVGDFATSTVDGELLTRAELTGETLVGFFSPSCQPCREKLPKFVEFARSMPGGRERVLAAVVGDAGEASGYAAELRQVARVVVENADGALSEAFKVNAYPAVLMVGDGDGGVVVRSNRVALDRPAAVPA